MTDYETLAARYDEDRAKWSYPRDDVIDELLASRAVVRVLDVGCGTGRWLVAQRDCFDDAPVVLIGADPSAAMLAEARPKQAGHLALAGAEALPVADAAVDYVVCSYVFHHVVDKERALDEFGRVVNTGGIVRINNIEPTAAEGWWLYEFFPEAIAIDAARFWPPDRLAGAFEARGFTVEVDIDTGPHDIAATEALADAERRVVSQLALLDDADYTRGLARLREAAATTDATVTTTRARLTLTARA